MSRLLPSPRWGTTPRGRSEMANSRGGKGPGQGNGERERGVYYMSWQ